MIGILESLMGLLERSGASSLTIGGIDGSQEETLTTVQAMADDAIVFNETLGV